MVLPLDKGSHLDLHIRGCKVQVAVNRDSRRNVYAGRGGAWTHDGLRLGGKNQHIEHGPTEYKPDKEEG